MTIQPDEEELHVIPAAGAPGTAGDGFRVVDRSDATEEEFRARVAVFDAAPAAPESNDDELWAALSDLIPCSEFGDCGEECECVEGELRLAFQRLIMAERVHALDCEGDDCCVALEHRARLVNKAAAITPEALRTRRAALRGDRG